MSKMNAEKKLLRRKLVLNREVLRTLSEQTLEQVAGGATQQVLSSYMGDQCGTLPTV